VINEHAVVAVLVDERLIGGAALPEEVTVNDGAFDGFVQGVARELLGPRSVVELPAPFMGAEDFSFVLQQVPGSMAVIGMRPPGEGPPPPCHSNRMKLDESGMAHGAALHAAVALRYLG
jgi:hippurate hydrolase